MYMMKKILLLAGIVSLAACTNDPEETFSQGGKFGPSEFDRQGRQSETFQYAPYDHDATVAHHVFDVYVTVCFHKNVQPMVYKDSERRAQRQMKTKFSGLAMPSRILSSW
jgi:hypothetical protein